MLGTDFKPSTFSFQVSTAEDQGGACKKSLKEVGILRKCAGNEAQNVPCLQEFAAQSLRRFFSTAAGAPKPPINSTLKSVFHLRNEVTRNRNFRFISYLSHLKMNLMSSRPPFEALPLRLDDPPYSAWGLYGEDDELGTLNLLTPETVVAAKSEIVTGQTISLKFEIQPLSNDTSDRPPVFR